MNQRPAIAIPQTRIANVLDIIGIIGLIVGLAIAILIWSKLPDTIPIHFGIDGRPNGWGNKVTFWLFPGLSLAIFFGFNWLRCFPQTFDYPVIITPENAERQYQIAIDLLNWLKIEIIWLFVYVEWQIYQLTNDRENFQSLGLLSGFIIPIFLTIAVFLFKAFQAR